jgi:hypothetical protein
VRGARAYTARGIRDARSCIVRNCLWLKLGRSWDRLESTPLEPKIGSGCLANDESKAASRADRQSLSTEIMRDMVLASRVSAKWPLKSLVTLLVSEIWEY